jgi:hypothetical protein
LKPITIQPDVVPVVVKVANEPKKAAKKRKLVNANEDSIEIVKAKDATTTTPTATTTSDSSIGDPIEFPWEIQNFDQFYEILNLNKPTETKPTDAKKAKIEHIDDSLIMQMEEKLVNRGNDAAENVDDFEKLLISSPNSSFYWIKYIVFYLQMAEIDKARQIAERALKTILYREENEKINVWVAYLNLENMYGTPEILDAVFQRALQNCDSLKMYSHLAEIYARSDKPQVSR